MLVSQREEQQKTKEVGFLGGVRLSCDETATEAKEAHERAGNQDRRMRKKKRLFIEKKKERKIS